MASRRVLVTGGVRSGKSRYAERLLVDESQVTYLAPGPAPDPVADPEWAARVAQHQDRRPLHWTTVETVEVAEAVRGSDGAVLSVNLVSTLPLADLDGRRVALGSTSRTSVLLAQMWLRQVHGVTPEYFACPPDLTAMLLEADAAVLIGDPALRATHGASRRGLAVHDLGAAWRDWTGLPMVFAAWAVRRDFAEGDPGLVKDVHDVFVRSRDLALAEVDEVARSAARWESFDAATLAGYFRTLDFSLGDRQLAGLGEFAARAAAWGAVPAAPEIRFAEV